MITSEDIIKVDITQDHIDLTELMAEQKAFKHSMRGTHANIIGTLGEIIAYEYLNKNNIEAAFDLQYNHDLVINECTTADVKTKERTVAPQLHYDCTIPEYNHQMQRPDVFIFVSLQADKKVKGIQRFHTGYVLGYMTMRNLEKKASYWTPEMTDTSNNWTPTIPCFNIRIEQLSRI